MITSAPACRAVCNGMPGEVVEHLVVAFKDLRDQGISEEKAVLLSRDPDMVVRLLPIKSLGALRSTAEIIVAAGCAECAVNFAYDRENS